MKNLTCLLFERKKVQLGTPLNIMALQRTYQREFHSISMLRDRRLEMAKMTNAKNGKGKFEIHLILTEISEFLVEMVNTPSISLSEQYYLQGLAQKVF